MRDGTWSSRAVTAGQRRSRPFYGCKTPRPSGLVRVADRGSSPKSFFDRPRRCPAHQVGGGAGLVVGAGGASTTERLLADDGAGRLVVDVEVACGETKRVADLGHGDPIPGDDRSGQRVRRCGVDLLEHV